METEKKRVLIFSAKWPTSNIEMDGGALTVKQYCEILSENYLVDYLYLQKNKDEELIVPDMINSYEIADGNYFNFDNYNKPNCNKFEARLNNIDYNNDLILSKIDAYDFIFIVHCCQAMGLEKKLNSEQLKKIIVMPMFLSNSYVLSGEIVPDEYIRREKLILNAVGYIITPSTIERDYMIQNMGVNENKVIVIPRAVGEEFLKGEKNRTSNEFNICYVASFKNQKNNITALKLIDSLQKHNIDARLYMVGSVQDKNVYNECLEYIKEHNIETKVRIYETMTQHNLAQLYEKMDIAISVSLCETFGRAIFEGLASGLPTVVLNVLKEVKLLSRDSLGIVFVKDLEKMVNFIKEIYNDKDMYVQMSKAASILGCSYSLDRQKKAVNEFLEGLQ